LRLPRRRVALKHNGEGGIEMRKLLFLLAMAPLSACVSTVVGAAVGTAVGVTGAVAGAAVHTTGAVVGAGVHAVTPHKKDHDDDDHGDGE
jgi:hypothetical protein